MIIQKFRKLPGDTKRLVLDYNNWLDADEMLTSVNMVGSVPNDGFFVDGYLIDDTEKLVIFFLSGGLSRRDYLVTATVATSKSQIKNDTIQMTVM